MTLGKIRLALALAGVLATVLPSAAASLSKTQVRCVTTIGKVGLGLVRTTLKLEQQCHNDALAGGGCTAPSPGRLGKLAAAARARLTKACALPAAGLRGLGFPGPCPDADPGDGFTPSDLADCILQSHDEIVGEMLTLQYDGTLMPPLPKARLACQREIAKRSAAFTACVLRSIQRCRAAVLKGRLPGVPAHLCATADPKTAATIATCRATLSDGIHHACDDADVASLAICTPDATTVDDAVTCLASAHTVRIDGPAIDVPPDLIDYEYAVRGGMCGDEVVNNLDEECDGGDAAACPGACGTAVDPDGYFACLCRTKPRVRVVEHASADTDNGWTGTSADQGVAEGGGYLGDLYDCDAFGTCNLGPSCSLPPHSSCGVLLSAPSGTTGDQICAALGQGMCRKERTATGPHCFRNIQKKCDMNQPADPVCDEPGDYCAVTLVAPPNPVASGGVTVCNVTSFSEDVVGTVNVPNGESTVRAPQRSRTFGRTVGAANKPCPVCGGFCAISKERCAVNADCPGATGPCITAPVCSDGLNAGRACRTAAPFASPTTFFGTTSVDCPPDPATEITSDAGLDLYIPTRTTGTATFAPSVPCIATGFTGNACLGGTSAGRPCTSATECPAGSCSPQCFCDGQVRPNACNAACVGGGNDAGECVSDSECPGGFCHKADCRLDATDSGSVQEGICTTGPAESWCSTTTYRPCSTSVDCTPPVCPYCAADETCIARNRACFLNGGILRQGAPRTPEGVSVGIYCITGDNAAVNIVAGFPGPAAFTQPERQLSVP